NVNRLTATLGEASVDAEEYYRERCAEIISTREWTKKELEKLSFTVLESDANFIFAKTDAVKGGDMYALLKKKGILVRHFGAERIKDYNRITIGTKEQMEAFIKAVKEIIGEKE
ncbi:MAG: aminotransferase class I/II-fold pyridoxal phosphate-dependent enzyme, partial [Clostridia bacterium]|nr:aminotransferase class I/II-fold pyridoxal phosphate-dependent enzyme [Clostridia bacterium]